MSIRIYNLAKELGLDSKVVIDVCVKLGIKSSSTQQKSKKADPKGKADADANLLALSTLSDSDAELVRKRIVEEKEAPKESGFRSLMNPVQDAPVEPPKQRPSKVGKIRTIQPARGRITEIDPNRRVVSPVKRDVPMSTKPSADGQEKVVSDKTDKKVPESVEPASKNEVAPEVSVVKPEVDKPEIVVPETSTAPVSQPEAAVDSASDGKDGKVSDVVVEDAAKSTKEAAPVVEEPPAVAQPETSAPVASPTASGKPVVESRRGLLRAGRDSQRRERDKDKDKEKPKGRDSRRGARQSEPTPTRPAPVSSSFLAELESKAQALDEMKRPPVITTHANDRVRVLGSQPQKSKTDSAASASSVSNRAGSKTNLPRFAAPLQPQKPAAPVKKPEKDVVEQKPNKPLPPEALRGAAVVGQGPLSQRRRAGSTGLSERSDRRTGTDGASIGSRGDRSSRASFSGRGESGYGGSQGGSSEYGQGKRSKKGGRDRDDSEGRDDFRGGSRRRQGNESRRLRNGGDDDAYENRYAPRVGGRSGRRDGGKQSAGGNTMPRKNDVVIETPCSVRQFAEATGLSVPAVIKKLMELGYMTNLNQSLDSEVLELLIVAFDLKATVKQEATLEETYVDAAFDVEDPPESLVPRGPVVTFLGHVDHGKTSLLDRILNLHVVQGEKGGITQHIRAYRVDARGGSVTFVDTPGHQAFTEMRARGANVTDVAVLVVAADDGVMPQTEEAITHARAAGVPIIVALNKMDLPGVNRDKVIQDLASNDLMPSEWGGDVEIVETSALTGMGVDNLLDTLLMVAELHELKANPNRPALGVVLEASMKSGEGVVCTALVQKGTLRPGDVVLCGSSYGRVRSMTDTLDVHKRLAEAGPGVPVSITGLDVAPDAGSRFVVLDDIAVARQIAEERAQRAHEIELAGAPSHVTLESLFDRINSAKSQQTLNVIIRADVRGSIEAIRKELGKLEHPEVKLKILQATVGGISEADVQLADASDAIILGFNSVPDEGARALAEAKKVQIRRYDVIYKLSEDIRAALEGMLKPEEQVKELGRALVQRTFNITRVGTIAGCRVLFGSVERDCHVRVIRNSRVIGEYLLETLKRERDDAKEVREGYECGIKLKNFNDVKEGDVLEAYKIEEVARTF